MSRAILVVLSRPHPGREDDFNDWYNNIHFRDAMRFRGSIATQRFTLNARRPEGDSNALGWRYVALYEVDNPARFTQEHIEALDTVRMEVSNAFDNSILSDFYYYPIAARSAGPISGDAVGLVLERIKAMPGKEAAFRDWYEAAYLPEAARRPGVQSATFLEYHPMGQMLPGDPEANFVAAYRLSDPSAMAAWDSGNKLFSCGLIDVGGTAVQSWDAIGPRLTKDAVLHPTAPLLASEEQARARLSSHRTSTDKAALVARG